MVSEVVNPNQSNPALAQQQQPSKKSSRFLKYKKKKAYNDFEEHYSQEGMPPSTPREENKEALLNVTVMHRPYTMSASDTIISDLTNNVPGGGTTQASSRKQVGFSPASEYHIVKPVDNHQYDTTTPSTLNTTASSSEGMLTDAQKSMNSDSKDLMMVSSSPAHGADCNNDLTGAFMGMFEDICTIPGFRKNLDSQLEAAEDSPEKNSKSGGAVWGSAPSRDDDDSSFGDADGRLTRGSRTTMEESNGLTRTTDQHTETETNNLQAQQEPEKPPTHENYEVVLDTRALESSKSNNGPSVGSKSMGKKSVSSRRKWFAKQGEEEKKSEDPEDLYRALDDVSAISEPKSFASTGQRNAAGNNSNTKSKSFINRLSAAKLMGAIQKGKEPSKSTSTGANKQLSEQSSSSVPAKTAAQMATTSAASQPSAVSSDERELVASLAEETTGQGATLKSVPVVKTKEAKTDSNDVEAWEGMAKELTATVPTNSAVGKPKQDVSAKTEKESTVKSQPEKTQLKDSEKKDSKSLKKRTVSFGVVMGKLAKPLRKSRSEPEAKKKSPSQAVKSTKSSTKAKASPPVVKIQKPSWKATVDPKSGKTYYYHRKTRETTWKKPKELKEYEEAQAKAKMGLGGEKEVVLVDKGGEKKDAGFDTPVRTTARGTAASSPADAESPLKPPSVIETDMTNIQNHSLLGRIEPSPSGGEDSVGLNKMESFDDTWEKKKEIQRLLTSLSPPDNASVEKLMKEYEGSEDQLLLQLQDLVESQPFDEPYGSSSKPKNTTPSSTLASHSPYRTRTMGSRSRTNFTHASRASATTKSSTKTDKTEKIKNTSRGRNMIPTISEAQSTATSISSHKDDDDDYDLRPPGSHHIEKARIPSKAYVPRHRELKVEEFTGSKAETYATSGRIVKGGFSDEDDESGDADIEDTYSGDNDTDTYGTDSVSALSEADVDFHGRKDNFDVARRRALDDAIEREDWELAAALSEGMRGTSTSKVTEAHASWSQTELDKFIANNDWAAVSAYIAQMRKNKEDSTTTTNDESSGIAASAESKSRKTGGVLRAPSRGNGQHASGLLSESSYTSGSSYDDEDTYDSDSYS